MDAKHTPTPWKHMGGGTVWAGNSRYALKLLGRFSEHDNSEDDAAFVVRAVNAHDELVAAADDALNCLIGCCVSAGGYDDRKTIFDTQIRLRKILAGVGVTYSEAL